MARMALFDSLTSLFSGKNDNDNDDNKGNGGKFAALDALLKAVAGHFLYHIPKEKIRGPQWLWGIVIAGAGPLGPIAFLAGGLKWDEKPWKDVLPSGKK